MNNRGQFNNEPAYLNKSISDLPGESWKDVPGFEGFYRASDQGRVHWNGFVWRYE
jgi:hypothetical protein